MSDQNESIDAIKERVRRNMTRFGIPVGTDNQTLLDLGARPFSQVPRRDGPFWRFALERLGARLGNWNDRHLSVAAIDRLASWLYVSQDR